MITLRRDNVVKQTESEVVALALESQGFVREGAAKKAAPENEATAAEKELKEELATTRSQNAALKQELDGAKDQLEVAQKARAYAMDYRKYHDIWVPDQQIATCFTNVKEELS